LMPTGSVSPPPAFLETEKNVGEPKTRMPASRVPFAGLMKGSSEESASAMESPPIPRFADGRKANCPPSAMGALFTAMTCACAAVSAAGRLNATTNASWCRYAITPRHVTPCSHTPPYRQTSHREAVSHQPSAQTAEPRLLVRLGGHPEFPADS